MKPSRSAVSSEAARPIAIIDKLSPRTLQPLRDAAHAGEERFEEVPVLAAARAPGGEQVDLHEVHRIDIRITQHDRALQGRICIEQPPGALHLEQSLAREL